MSVNKNNCNEQCEEINASHKPTEQKCENVTCGATSSPSYGATSLSSNDATSSLSYGASSSSSILKSECDESRRRTLKILDRYLTQTGRKVQTLAANSSYQLKPSTDLLSHNFTESLSHGARSIPVRCQESWKTNSPIDFIRELLCPSPLLAASSSDDWDEPITALQTEVGRKPTISKLHGEQRVCMIQSYINAVSEIYPRDVDPVMSFVENELLWIAVLENYIFAKRLPEDLQSVSSLFIAKALGDLTLRVTSGIFNNTEVQGDDNSDLPYNLEVFDVGFIYRKAKSILLDAKPTSTMARGMMVDFATVFLITAAQSCLKSCDSNCSGLQYNNEHSCGCPLNFYYLQCLSLIDKPRAASRRSAYKAFVNAFVFPDEDDLLNDGRWSTPPQLDVSELTELDPEDLPDFEEFYGAERLRIFRKALQLNASLCNAALTSEELETNALNGVSERPTVTLFDIITKARDAIRQMLTFEVLTASTKKKLLQQYLDGGLATADIVEILCQHYIGRRNKVLPGVELPVRFWETFLIVFQRLDNGSTTYELLGEWAPNFNSQDDSSETGGDPATRPNDMYSFFMKCGPKGVY